MVRVCRAGLAAALLAASVPAHAQNLIASGDFENEGEGALPAEWLAEGATTGEAQVVREQGPSGGEKALLIAGREGLNASVSTTKIPIDPNRPLVISGWMKGSGELNAAGGYVMVTFFDEGGMALGRDSQSPERTSRNLCIYGGEEWKEFQREFLPEAQFSPGTSGRLPLPANAAYFELKMATLGYPGNLWFDGLFAVQD